MHLNTVSCESLLHLNVLAVSGESLLYLVVLVVSCDTLLHLNVCGFKCIGNGLGAKVGFGAFYMELSVCAFNLAAMS